MNPNDPVAQAKYQQEDLISGGCKRVYGADPHRKFFTYGEAFDQLLPYHLFLDIDPEEADMAESADQAGGNIVMSRQHVARDDALRRAQQVIRDVEPIAVAVKRRLEDMQNNPKRRRVYEEYTLDKWMQEARRATDEATHTALTNLARARRALEEARRGGAAPGAAGPAAPGGAAPQQLTAQQQAQQAQQAAMAANANTAVQQAQQAQAQAYAAQQQRQAAGGTPPAIAHAHAAMQQHAAQQAARAAAAAGQAAAAAAAQQPGSTQPQAGTTQPTGAGAAAAAQRGLLHEVPGNTVDI